MHKHLIVILTLGMVGCGLTSTANDMKNSTEEIRDNSKNMPVMKEDTSHLAKRTDDLEYEGTYDRTTSVMKENLASLWRENLALGKSLVLPNGEADQLLNAGVTIQSMWFQFWKGDYRESTADLDWRLSVGTQILFTKAMLHSPVDGDVRGKFGFMPDYSWTGIAALGASLDYVSDRYKESAIRAGLQRYTYYDIIMQALRIRNGSRESTVFPRTVEELRSYGKIVEYMIQLRHNYLPVMVVCFLTNFKDQWTPVRGWSTMFGQTASLEGVDVVQLQRWTKWLRQAKQTRADLRAAGIEPKYNWVLSEMVKKVDFGQAELLAQPFDKLSGIDLARAEFAAAYAEVTMEEAPAAPRASLPPPPRPEQLLPIPR